MWATYEELWMGSKRHKNAKLYTVGFTRRSISGYTEVPQLPKISTSATTLQYNMWFCPWFWQNFKFTDYKYPQHIYFWDTYYDPFHVPYERLLKSYYVMPNLLSQSWIYGWPMQLFWNSLDQFIPFHTYTSQWIYQTCSFDQDEELWIYGEHNYFPLIIYQ